MKNSVLRFASTLVITLALIVPAFAQQTTHLRTVELEEFDQIRVSLDTDVILIKSDRNQLTLVGDSSYIAEFPVSQNDSILSFSYNENESKQLKRVIIEYKELDRAITGGDGTYFFHKLSQRDLEIFNPFAKVVLTGRAENLRIYSEEGDNDVTGLIAGKMVLHIGDSATLLKRSNTRYYTARRVQ